MFCSPVTFMHVSCITSRDGHADTRARSRSFESKKRAQELQAARHIDLDDSGSESESESETEDEDAEMLTPALDVQVRWQLWSHHDEARLFNVMPFFWQGLLRTWVDCFCCSRGIAEHCSVHVGHL